jgi:cellulose synthase/poly-beta-1,6-N-acetylglucosamine synthase-like glycosyltransferase
MLKRKTDTEPQKPARFGEIALQKGWINEAQLSQATTRQSHEKTPIGKILQGMGALRHMQVRDILAMQWQLPTVDLLKTPPYPGMVHAEDRHRYEKFECIPWREEKGITWIATTMPTEALRQWAQHRYGDQRYQLMLTSPLDIQRTLAKHFADEDSNDACFRLKRRAPHQSADQIMSPNQRRWLSSTALLVIMALFLAPISTTTALLLILNIFFAATLLFKVSLILIGRQQTEYVDPNIRLLNDDQLPVYTLLIPLYKEKDSLSHLIEAVRQLDYPKSKLDVKLIVESDDPETFAALKQLKPETYFDIIRVPVSAPRTKPKACNYALRFAKGELIAIYDAEDQPEPLQLRKTASFFVQHDGRTVCLQARLNYYNRQQNLLTQLFSIEYGVWFNYMLHGLSRIGVPIPLGGTSNHLARHTLERMHAWDAHNVTEDADLGYRIAMNGGHTGLVNSMTLEEAPMHMTDWLKQRSRWIKGYMQTYLVHMRHPLSLYQRIGFRGFMGFQLFVGGPVLTYLSAPILWGIWAAWTADLIDFSTQFMHGPLISLIYFNLLGGLLLHLWQASVLVKDQQWKHMHLAVLGYPFYWILHSLAGFRAFWQLIHHPHYWEKTPHGQSLLAHTDKENYAS